MDELLDGLLAPRGVEEISGFGQGETFFAGRESLLDHAGDHFISPDTDGHLSSTKNHETRIVPLTEEVVTLLGEWWGECGRPAEGNVLVFPGSGGYLSNTTVLRRELCLLRCDREPERFSRAAVRWHGRYCKEVDAGLEEALAVLAALGALRSPRRTAAAYALSDLISQRELQRACEAVNRWANSKP
jgi:hypothetical protein